MAEEAVVQEGPQTRVGPRSFLLPLFLLVFAVLAFWNAARRDFWGEEATHALVTRTILEGTPAGTAGASEASALERWLVPSLDGKPWLKRPPLGYWLSALTGSIPGLPARLTYRLPSLLGALLGLCLTYRLAIRLFDRRVAFLALSIQGSTALWFYSASWLGTDLLFAVFCQLAISGFALAPFETRSTLWRLLGWVGLALACLTKSAPLAFGLVFGSLFFFWFLGKGRFARVRQGLRETLARGGPLLFLALTLPWYVQVALQHGLALWQQHVLDWHWQQLTDSSAGGPPYHYLLLLPLAYLPWTVFLPLAFFHGKDRLGRPGQRLAFSWMLFVFVALCLIDYRRIGLLLPMWPVPGILIAAAFFETREQFSLWEDYLADHVFKIVPYLFRLPIFLTLLAAAAWYAGLTAKIPDEYWREALSDKSVVQPLLIIAAIAGAASFWAGRRIEQRVREEAWQKATLEMCRGGLFVLFAGSFLVLALNPLQSARPFLDRVVDRAGSARLATYGKSHPGEVAFYLDSRRVEHIPQLAPLAKPGTPEDQPRAQLESLADSARAAYVLTAREELDALRVQYPGLAGRLELTEVAGRMGVRGDFVLLANPRATAIHRDKPAAKGDETEPPVDAAPQAEKAQTDEAKAGEAKADEAAKPKPAD